MRDSKQLSGGGHKMKSKIKLLPIPDRKPTAVLAALPPVTGLAALQPCSSYRGPLPPALYSASWHLAEPPSALSAAGPRHSMIIAKTAGAPAGHGTNFAVVGQTVDGHGFAGLRQAAIGGRH